MLQYKSWLRAPRALCQGRCILSISIGRVPFGTDHNHTDGMALLSRIAVAAVIVAVVYYILGALLSYRRLRQFRGPPLASFSRLWIFWKECKGGLPQAQITALEKYGMRVDVSY